MNISDLNTQREIWNKVLLNISNSNKFSKNVVNSYFNKTFIHSVERNKIIVGCESTTVSNILKTNFKDSFLIELANVTGTNFDIVFVPISELGTKSKTQIINENEPPYFKSVNLSPNFTFDNFIEGPSNKDAKRAAYLIATNPGTLYNPYYIQGDSGLGKTHLLQAIAHQIRENFPEKKILCISSQNFFDEYRNFLKNAENQLDLTSYLKDVDVFLIDDIQQLKGREKTLDYFFDIYNYFISNNKQVVITSDRPQNELEGIPNRLITRFLSGLSVIITKPNFSTCKQILEKKIAFSSMNIDDFEPEAIDFIAENFSSSIRELEGILTRLTFYTTINDYKGKITLALTLEALGLPSNKIDKVKTIDASSIINAVSSYYSISVDQLKGTVRKAQVALARQIAIYLIRETLDCSFEEIGKIFSNRDHSTIMHSVNKISYMLKTDQNLQNVITSLKEKIQR